MKCLTCHAGGVEATADNQVRCVVLRFRITFFTRILITYEIHAHLAGFVYMVSPSPFMFEHISYEFYFNLKLSYCYLSVCTDTTIFGSGWQCVDFGGSLLEGLCSVFRRRFWWVIFGQSGMTQQFSCVLGDAGSLNFEFCTVIVLWIFCHLWYLFGDILLILKRR
jgi:hypothetical protein